jgi:glycine/D-amino acid oxidase-like deaminating enzyme/nitrite reductase/ring-hydroxylating ferredoxin subunit
MSQSAWQTSRLPKFKKLNKSLRVDTVVIGGGITGLSAAYFLKMSGKDVAVVERDRIGMGDTGMTTAHLTAVTDMRLSTLAKTFGEEQARLVWEGGARAIDAIDAVALAEGIHCDFRRVPGFLHAPLREQPAKDEIERFRKEAELGARLGIPVEFVQSAPIVNRPGLRFADQAKFDPLDYLGGLARAIHGDDCEIFENTEATEVDEDPLVIHCGKHKIQCDHLVIATHVPLMGATGLVRATLLQSKLFHYSSYAIGAKVSHGTLPEVSLWDTSDPYYYLRIDQRKSGPYAIFGGEDHKTGQSEDTEASFERLSDLLRELLPSAQIDRRWSGQVIETNDGLPYVGPTAERQFVATGFAGNGMTFGTLAGMMAADWVLGRTTPWQELFAVNRTKVIGGTKDYLKENLDFPWFLIKDRLSPAEGHSPEEVEPGTGKILNIDGRRIACSRDEQGHLEAVSAVCTHLGCLVRWNQAEHTWDCPCHGSRFKPDGSVLAGPAETALAKFEVSQNGAAAGQAETRQHQHSGGAAKGP